MEGQMMTAVYTKEKGVHLKEVPVPQLRADTDVIVKVTIFNDLWN